MYKYEYICLCIWICVCMYFVINTPNFSLTVALAISAISYFSSIFTLGTSSLLNKKQLQDDDDTNSVLSMESSMVCEIFNTFYVIVL